MVFNTSLLPIQAQAPEFSLLDQAGHSRRLLDLQGKQGTVLVFISSDWLQGDIRLLEAYRDAYDAFRQAGLGLAAISGINWEKLHYLAQRLNLPFPLLFDPCCRISKQYQAMLIPKFVNGRAIYGINPEGRIVFAQKQTTPMKALAAFSG